MFIQRSFELTDMNRQTTWITVYDGRGVYAERVHLNIHVKDNNIVWIDVKVDCITFEILSSNRL